MPLKYLDLHINLRFLSWYKFDIVMQAVVFSQLFALFFVGSLVLVQEGKPKYFLEQRIPRTFNKLNPWTQWGNCTNIADFNSGFYKVNLF